jgi:hypothetical protein
MRTLARATGLVPDTTPRPPSLPNLAQAFVDTFTHTLVGLREDEGEDARLMPWFLEVRTQLAQHGGLVFLSTDMFTYTGGAHPNAHQGYYVFDKQTGNPVGLQDFVHDARSLAELQAMAEVKFRKQEGIKHNEDYKPYYFKDKKFVLPQNWRIARDSLEFVYNLYEIKPYADGFTYVRLPLSAVEVFIKPQYRRPQS